METLQPKLRFPEFIGNWEIYSLGNIAKFSKGKGISKSQIDENGLYECIRYGELYTVYGETIKDVRSRTNLSKNDLVFSESNDVIIPASGETQLDIATASCVLKDGVALGGDLNIIKTDNNGVFLAYYLNSSKKEDIASLAQGVSVVHLYSSQLATLNINLPSLPEQTRIADFLSSVDEKLHLLKEKKALLEEYKKGMMQKIFNQEIRFKDDNGEDFGDWEEKVLGEIAEISKGTQLNKDDLNKIDIYPSISGGIEPSGYTNKFNREKDTIIISEGGNSCGYVNFIRTKFWCGGHCYSIDVLNDFSKLFIFQLLKFYQDEIMRLRVGSGLPNIQKKDLKVLKLTLPTVIEEQTKIAQFLSAIDDKIGLVGNQIEETVAYKKGLLQGMFV
jgi:type I restriction enzyme S subunit